MNIEIRKLSADLLDDWLYFFDNTAFSDNDEWAGCYCMCYHWTEAMNAEKAWDCSKADAAYNRKCAVRFIKEGLMQGYLAYSDGKVIGWCNANDTKAYYDSVNIDMDWEENEKGRKTKSVVCFCIAPGLRGRGIASNLLEKLCSDAASDGYEYIEAYPFTHGENNDYHGSKSMYEKKGFKTAGKESGVTIMRKYL